jgi:hypothetical protein
MVHSCKVAPPRPPHGRPLRLLSLGLFCIFSLRGTVAFSHLSVLRPLDRPRRCGPEATWRVSREGRQVRAVYMNAYPLYNHNGAYRCISYSPVVPDALYSCAIFAVISSWERRRSGARGRGQSSKDRLWVGIMKPFSLTGVMDPKKCTQPPWVLSWHTSAVSSSHVGAILYGTFPPHPSYPVCVRPSGWLGGDPTAAV